MPCSSAPAARVVHAQQMGTDCNGKSCMPKAASSAAVGGQQAGSICRVAREHRRPHCIQNPGPCKRRHAPAAALFAPAARCSSAAAPAPGQRPGSAACTAAAAGAHTAQTGRSPAAWPAARPAHGGEVRHKCCGRRTCKVVLESRGSTGEEAGRQPPGGVTVPPLRVHPPTHAYPPALPGCRLAPHTAGRRHWAAAPLSACCPPGPGCPGRLAARSRRHTGPG